MAEQTPDISNYIDPNTGQIRQDLQVDLSAFEKQYLDANPDVAQAVGGVPGAGIQHYLDYGKTEGRSGVSPALQNLNALGLSSINS